MDMDWKTRAECYKHGIVTQGENDSGLQQFRMITPNSTVLDVGCACGGMGKVLFQKSCNVYGCDYNPYSLQEATKTGAYNELFLIDLNNFIPDNYPNFHSLFDFIILGDVLEHLIEPADVLAKLKGFLKCDGNFVISLPNIAHSSVKMSLLCDDFTYTATGLLDCTHLRFFTYKTIPEFYGKIGLKIEDVSGVIVPPDINALKHFPVACRRLIVKDLHSWIFQYVMRVCITSESPESLVAMNRKKMEIHKENLPSEIYFYTDKSHYVKYVYGTFLGNIVDAFGNLLRRKKKEK